MADTTNRARIELTVDQSGLGAQLRDVLGQIQKQGQALAGAFLAGGGLQAAIQLFGQYVDVVNQSVESTLQLRRATQSWDAGQLSSGIADVNKQLERMSELAERAKPGQFGGLAAQFLLAKEAAGELLGGARPEDVREALTQRLRVVSDIGEARKQTALLVKGAERDLQELAIKQQTEVRRGNLEAAQSLQREVSERMEAEDVLRRGQLRTRQETERAEAITKGVGITAEMRKRQALEVADLDQELANRRTKQAEKFAEQERRLQAELAEVETDRQRLAVERESDEARFAANAVKRESERKVSALATAGAIMDAERALARARADANNTILDDVQKVADERRRISGETAAAEIRGVEAETAAILKALGARREQAQRELGGLAALEGVLSAPEMARRRNALAAQVESLQGEINEAAAVGAHKRARIEEQAAAQQRQIFLREQQERLSILQATLARETAMRQSVTGTLATLGLRTSRQAIEEQFGLAAAARPGSAQQAAAFQAAAQGLAQRQGESRGAVGGILGAVAERLGGEGSLLDVQQAFADIQQEAKQTVADFRAGGRVDLAGLQQAMGLLPLGEQAGRLGGVGAIFGQAATPLAEQFKAMAGPEGATAFDALVTGADRSLGELVTSFNTTFDQLDRRVDESAQRWVSTVSGVMPDMAAAIERELVRSIDLARAKR